jgi:hypothetical protein
MIVNRLTKACFTFRMSYGLCAKRTFPLLMVMKLTNTERDYVQISCTEFHSNQTISEENMDRS